MTVPRLAALLLALTPVFTFAQQDTSAVKNFRITGVVLSSRDGAPVPHCRLSASESQSDGQDSGPQERGGGFPGRRGGFDRGGATAGQSPEREFGGRRGMPQQDTVETDAQGRFSLSVAHAGAWRLTGSARGFRTQSYEQHDGFFAAVVLTSAAPEFAVSFKLIPDSTLTGLVLDEAGEPVRQAQVRVERTRDPQPNSARLRPQGGGTAMTDDRGRYEVTGLAPGAYQVRVTARPWYAASSAAFNAGAGRTPSPDPSLDLTYAETWSPAATDAATADEIVLGGGEEREADVHLTPIPATHLRIPREDASPLPGDGGPLRGSPMPEIDREGGDRVQTPVTTSGTDWDISGLAPGNYTVRVGFGPDARSTPLHIAAGSPAVIGMSTDAGATVTLTVDGLPPDEVRSVSLLNLDTGQSYATGEGRRDRGGETDTNGPRTLTAPAGRYEVFLSGNPELYLKGLSASDAKTEGRTVTLTGAAVKLTLHAGSGRGQVKGVARLDGRPADGAMVLLVPADFGQPGSVAPVLRDETNTDGSFTVARVLPDEYILVTIDGGWAVNWRDPATLMKYLVSGVPVDLRNAGTVKKDVEAVAP